MSEIIICIPAWGDHYRWVAANFAIPALVAALQKVSLSYEFVIYTDEPTPFMVLPHVSAQFREPPVADTPHDALTAIHTRTLIEAPTNSIVGLFNSDIVPSVEVFATAALAFSAGYQVMASFGLRTLMSGLMQGPPPIGATAAELFKWGWAHRHPIVDNCIWGQGKTAFPVTLFFVNGHSNVVAHCSHLHPFLVRKQDRDYNFRGTVDDGLLHLYKEEEIYYCSNGQVGFIELSPAENPVAPHFMSKREEVVDESFVIEFGQHYLTSHCRNLRHAFRILGDKHVYDTPAIVIADAIKGNM